MYFFKGRFCLNTESTKYACLCQVERKETWKWKKRNYRIKILGSQ